MGPAQCLCDRLWLAFGGVEPAEAGVGVSLKDAAPAREMSPGMLPATVMREAIERGGRRAAGEGTVVADVDPEPSGIGLALRQHRGRGVVAMQPLGGEHVGLDPRVRRRQRGGGRADLMEHLLRKYNVPATGDEPDDYKVFTEDPQDRPW